MKSVCANAQVLDLYTSMAIFLLDLLISGIIYELIKEVGESILQSSYNSSAEFFTFLITPPVSQILVLFIVMSMYIFYVIYFMTTCFMLNHVDTGNIYMYIYIFFYSFFFLDLVTASFA